MAYDESVTYASVTSEHDVFGVFVKELCQELFEFIILAVNVVRHVRLDVLKLNVLRDALLFSISALPARATVLGGVRLTVKFEFVSFLVAFLQLNLIFGYVESLADWLLVEDMIIESISKLYGSLINQCLVRFA